MTNEKTPLCKKCGNPLKIGGGQNSPTYYYYCKCGVKEKNKSKTINVKKEIAQKIPYSKAIIIAEKYKKLFVPYCSRIEIAGSIRRQCKLIGDLEIVCILKNLNGFANAVNKLEKIKGEPTGKYTQRLLPEGIKLDLFMANEKNWGNIFLIRTGNWQFSRQIMIRVLRMGFKQKDGYLWEGGKMLECREEEDIFKILKLHFVPPKYRNNEIYVF